MTVTVLTQASAGAPSLTGEDGSLYSVLKWALVELGWTVAFDDAVNFKAAFRNNPATGTGRYLRIRDKAADHGDQARRCAVDSFLTMSDIDTGTGFYPATDHYWQKSITSDSTTRSYTIIGTDRWFYFLPRPSPNGRQLFRIFFFGDYIKFNQAKVDAAVLAASDVTFANANNFWGGLSRWCQNNPTAGTSETNTDIKSGLSEGYASMTNGVTCQIVGGNPTLSNVTNNFFGSTGDVGQDPITNAISTMPAYLSEGLNAPRFGILPNLLIPMCDLRIVQPGNTSREPGEIYSAIANPYGAGNAIYLPMTNTFSDDVTSTRQGACLIDVSQDWMVQ